ncbi:MAG TPA: nucleotidyl transferase AbiEii/AbiGii toxin family protein [Candidatus Peribacteraceae bacterium]|nr:nucleotidyl transferase AbiEii/AbiGii toxin family protein [Candidatus Peribacteraceae bacterium]
MNTPEILTDVQRRVLTLLANHQDLARAYVLSGGTALAAFHLHHRLSDDLDFFSLDPVDSLRIERFVEEVRNDIGARDIEPTHIYDRRLFVLTLPDEQTLKLEFTHYPYTHLETPSLHDGIQVESLRDIATDKLAAMLDRFEPKDYYDLCLLLSKYTDLARVRADLLTKFHIRTDPMQLGVALARAGNLPILPHMLMKTLTRDDVKIFFEGLAKDLRAEIIE